VELFKMEIQLYIANLGKYNEGILMGEWFTLPVDMSEVAKTIGLNAEYEECAIHDFEAPFRIGEYDNIERLNEIAFAMNSIDEDTCEILCLSVSQGIHSDFLDALDAYQDGSLGFHVYHDCKDMSDVAYYVVEEHGLIVGASSLIQSYFDYEAYGRDLAIEGNFVQLDSTTYVEFYS
jgi:antirestriction protein